MNWLANLRAKATDSRLFVSEAEALYQGAAILHGEDSGAGVNQLEGSV
jgi:hypothetical protein